MSALAIVETLAAIALVFYLSSYLNTLRWLAFAMCVSPLLLLRTEESTRLAIEWFDRWQLGLARVLEDPNLVPDRWYTVTFVLFGWVGTPVTAFGARIAATTIATLRDPATAVRAIPRNWARVTLAMDTVFPPELVADHPEWIFHRIVQNDANDLWAKKGKSRREWYRLVEPYFLFLPIFLPAYLYRWSVKATSIIYAPLVFIVHTTFRHVPDLRTKLELIKRSDVSRILALYAVCYVAAFVVKLVFMMNLPGFVQWWNGGAVRQFVALYVAPSEIPKWQVASLTNCALALAAWLFARQALLRIEVGRPWPEGAVQRAIGFAAGLRTVLALYTIACTGYITLRAARGWHWPALGEKWLPWQ